MLVAWDVQNILELVVKRGMIVVPEEGEWVITFTRVF
jgi:hypothetical protein